MAEFDQILETALDWIRADKKVALATVVQTWGSAPCPVGSQLAISEDAGIAGSVSGGCVESAVVVEALEAVEDSRVRLLEFGVSDDEAFAVGLACGGTIRVMVEPIAVGQGPSIEMLEALVARRAERRAAAYVVNTETWQRRLSDGQNDPLAAEILARFRSDKSGFEGDWFIGIHNPPLRMIVVGAVHIAQPLMQMARLSGYDTTLVDPREAFATSARFPGEKILTDWSDEALRAEGLDARTAVVTLSHDPKIDDPAIIESLNSEVFYLGCLGSKKTHAKRVKRLESAGLSAVQIRRIHAPVGLAIGGGTPAEIALSVMAQITDTLRNTGAV